MTTAIRNPTEFAAHFSVSRETLDRLTLYEALLRQWQPAVNLVAPSSLDQVWSRHFADSAQLLAVAPNAKQWLDLGSGAGFPGLVIAQMLMGQADRRVTLIESDQRKAAFLAEVARQTRAPVSVVGARIENAATHDKVGPFDVVTARALAPLPRLLGLAHRFFGPGTIGLFLKGRNAEQEVLEAAKAWTFGHELRPSLTDAEGRIVLIRELKRKGG